jgi:hypothetical protein
VRGNPRQVVKMALSGVDTMGHPKNVRPTANREPIRLPRRSKPWLKKESRAPQPTLGDVWPEE